MDSDYFIRPRRVYLGQEGTAFERCWDRLSEWLFKWMINRCPVLHTILLTPNNRTANRVCSLFHFLVGCVIGWHSISFLQSKIITTTNYSAFLLKQLFTILFALLYSTSRLNRTIIFIYPIIFLSTYAFSCLVLSTLPIRTLIRTFVISLLTFSLRPNRSGSFMYPAIYLTLLLNVSHMTSTTLYSNLVNASDSGQCLLRNVWNNTYQIAESRMLPVRIFLTDFVKEHNQVMNQAKEEFVGKAEELEMDMMKPLLNESVDAEKIIDQADVNSFADQSRMTRSDASKSNKPIEARENEFARNSADKKITYPCNTVYSQMINVRIAKQIYDSK